MLVFPGDAILSSSLGVSLKGVAIGNGWIDAERQYPAYLDYAVKHGLVEENSDVGPQYLTFSFRYSHFLLLDLEANQGTDG